MHRSAYLALVLCLSLAVAAAHGEVVPKRGLTEVGQAHVELRGGFWGPRLKAAAAVTIPHALDELEKDGHVANFDKAAGVEKGKVAGHSAFDSDLYKVLEGAAYSLRHFADQPLQLRVDGMLGRIQAAQQKDGFLIAYFIVQEQDQRWDDLRLMHQMYCAGHYFEMATALQGLPGQGKVLDSARRFADHIDGIFGPGKRYDVDGHQEVELALVKLYRATGEARYLELAKFFLDERGYAHGTERKPFDPAKAVPPTVAEGLPEAERKRLIWRNSLRVRNGRMQDHKPVIEQMEAVGHAVRAGYMYGAMADVLRFAEAPGYEKALDSLWADVVGRKMYLTGGLGTNEKRDEGFSDAYVLPNAGYCETCAAISHVLWQHRMALLKADAKYADVMELALYNGVLSGISLAGDQFFYQNPLVAKANTRRKPWIGLSCCPTNLARLLPQVGGLQYAVGKDEVFVNLYAAGEATVAFADTILRLKQETEYPWNGRIRLTVTNAAYIGSAKPWPETGIALRIPGWALGRPVPSDLYRYPAEPSAIEAGTSLKVNGGAVDAKPQADGYVHLKRIWKTGDVLELDLPMPARRVYPHEKIVANQGKVALMRGPVVYCLESTDQPEPDLGTLYLPPANALTAEHRADLLGGVTVLRAEGVAAETGKPFQLTAVPAYAWSNREPSAMTVWFRETPEPPKVEK
ncbi:MAG: glycoside hydrolase family 127 protein [Chthoniobacter sp.]|nr:glycoside hydrolase family 127 protein [Chthoniobacter sp.]